MATNEKPLEVGRQASVLVEGVEVVAPTPTAIEPDPLTMAAEDVTSFAEETARQVTERWMVLGVALRRIYDERLYAKENFASFREYVEDRLACLRPTTANHYLAGVRYLQEEAPERLRVIDGVVGTHNRPLSNEAVVKLKALREKVRRGEVARDVYERLRDAVLAGEISGSMLRRRIKVAVIQATESDGDSARGGSGEEPNDSPGPSSASDGHEKATSGADMSPTGGEDKPGKVRCAASASNGTSGPADPAGVQETDGKVTEPPPDVEPEATPGNDPGTPGGGGAALPQAIGTCEGVDVDRLTLLGIDTLAQTGRDEDSPLFTVAAGLLKPLATVKGAVAAVLNSNRMPLDVEVAFEVYAQEMEGAQGKAVESHKPKLLALARLITEADGGVSDA